MNRILISLMVVFCLVATPLLIESIDGHEMADMATSYHSASLDSHSNHNQNNALHEAHHCCGHATSMSFSSPATIYSIAISMENKLVFSANPFGSTYQPSPLLEPPSHV